MNTSTINLAQQFSRYPAGRLKADGPHSGEKFREDLLAPELRKRDKVTVHLDGAAGYGSSFLEEAFGGLLRHGFDFQTVKSKLILETQDESLAKEIWSYIEDQAKR